MLRHPTHATKERPAGHRRLIDTDHRRQPESQPEAHAAQPAHVRQMLALQRTIGNSAVREILHRDEAGQSRDLRAIGKVGREILHRDDTEPDKPPPSKTLYMGMNPGAKGEVKALKGALKDDVIAAMNDPALEKSLETDEGIARWLMAEMPTLIDNPLQFIFSYLTIQSTDGKARDQMAQVIKMFHAAERGLFRLERLVLSGHSNGVQLWGDEAENFNPGGFVLDDAMGRLTSTFPKAAAQVEDVMFSACYTVSSIELVIKVFPNVRTVWGYAGTSPAAGAGAEAHISKWERETRGDKTLQASDAAGKSALWTRDAAESSEDKRGYIRNDPAKANLKQLKESFYGMSIDCREQFRGEKATNMTILNQAYFYVQMMLAHPDVKEDERAILIEWREKLLRMRHLEKISGFFASTYAAEIVKGYAAIGRTPPSFSKLSRVAFKAEKEAFEAALAATPNPDAQAFYDKLLLPFWKLDATLIPATWI